MYFSLLFIHLLDSFFTFVVIFSYKSKNNVLYKVFISGSSVSLSTQLRLYSFVVLQFVSVKIASGGGLIFTVIAVIPYSLMLRLFVSHNAEGGHCFEIALKTFVNIFPFSLIVFPFNMNYQFRFLSCCELAFLTSLRLRSRIFTFPPFLLVAVLQMHLHSLWPLAPKITMFALNRETIFGFLFFFQRGLFRIG